MILSALKSPRFLAVATIMAIGIGLRQHPGRSLEHRPAAVSLRIPLADTPTTLGPYEFAQKIELHDSVKRKLNADEQITWVYRDQTKGQQDPGSAIRVHAAFYTGYDQTLRVRHVPEICYVNFGHTAVDSHRGTISAGPNQNAIPIQVFRFSPNDAKEEYATAYCFVANGIYCAAADEVRIACSNPDVPTSYFIKLELLSGNLIENTAGITTFVPAPTNTKTILKQSQEFLSALFPHLEQCLP